MKAFKNYTTFDYVFLAISSIGTICVYVLLLYKHNSSISEVLQVTAFIIPIGYLFFQFGHTVSGSVNNNTWVEKRNINKFHVLLVLSASVCLYLMSFLTTWLNI